MNRDPISARQAVQNAKQELKRGDRRAARRWAEFAASVAPGMEQPWLILAGLASPRSSIAYLKRALQINPKSENARKGMRWATQRLRQEEAKRPQPARIAQTRPMVADCATTNASAKKGGDGRGTHAQGPLRIGSLQIGRSVDSAEALGQPPAIQGAAPWPAVSHRRAADACLSWRPACAGRPGQGGTLAPAHLYLRKCRQVQANGVGQDRLAARRRSFLPLLLFLACITIAWAVWPGNASPALAFIRENISLPQATPTLPGAAAEVLKPTYTPTFTPTFTPTPTATLTPTPTPTNTPTPTPTDTPTPLPTDTPEVVPTLEPDTPVPFPPGGDGERWIDVNLSQQRVYAYEGSVVVNSFLVSTGTWQHPTVAGQYHIYIKLLYANMSGPGYYLPNVPYTMYYYKGYALHGTYWHHNFGTPMSHGCVNLSIPDAEWLFDWASIGTLVNVHY
jgi:lipoprotein-anchoring transpeptidase ErfK/SrfK